LLCSTGRPERDHFEEIEPALTAVSRRMGLDMLALPIKSVGVKADLRSYEHPGAALGRRGVGTAARSRGRRVSRRAARQQVSLVDRRPSAAGRAAAARNYHARASTTCCARPTRSWWRDCAATTSIASGS